MCFSSVSSNVLTIPFLRSSDGTGHTIDIDRSWTVFYITRLQYILQFLRREHQETVFYNLSLIPSIFKSAWDSDISHSVCGHPKKISSIYLIKISGFVAMTSLHAFLSL
jgi:hypothetical protein